MDNFLTEEEVKRFINNYYTAHGYSTVVEWGHTRGTDITATRGN